MADIDKESERYVLIVLNEAERRPTMNEEYFDLFTAGDIAAGWADEVAEAKRRYFAKPRPSVDLMLRVKRSWPPCAPVLR